MSDRKIADTVNKLKQIAIDFHDHQSLRQRIREEVLALVKEYETEYAKLKRYIEDNMDFDDVERVVSDLREAGFDVTPYRDSTTAILIAFKINGKAEGYEL